LEEFAFVEIILWLIYIVLGLALLTVVWSLYRGLKNRSGEGFVNGIRSSLLAWIVTGLLIACLVVTWLCGSTQPMIINGEVYDDKMWLRLSDMFVYTIIVMIVIAVLAVLFGFTRYYRKRKR